MVTITNHTKYTAMTQAVSFKFYPLKRRQKKNGEIPIYLRLTQNGKYQLMSTGIAILEKFWNDKGYIKKSHPRSRALNSQLDIILNEAKEALRELPPGKQNPKSVKDRLGNTGKGLFFLYADSFVQSLFDNTRYWPGKRTQVAVNHFERFIGSRNITFEEITPEILEKFQVYSQIELKHQPNTINKVFECIKRIFVSAIDRDITINNPFMKFKPVSRVKSDKTRLSKVQIQAIEKHELDPGSSLFHARNAFMFSFYCAGIRFSDICRLKWVNIIDGRLVYKMGKTGTGKNIKLLPPALKILGCYQENATPKNFVFPFLDNDRDYSNDNYLKAQISSKNAIVNNNLGKIAELVNIQAHISFHVSRHSFADYARTSGMNIYDISKALGHSDITITQAYLKSFDETSLDSSMEKLFKE